MYAGELQSNDRRETPALAGEGARGLPRKLRSFSSIFCGAKNRALDLHRQRAPGKTLGLKHKKP